MATEATLLSSFRYPAGGSAELIRMVEEGLPVDCLTTLREWGLTFTEVGELVIPPRTVKHRKAKGERLTTEETERFLRVMRVLEFGEQVFGKREKLLSWLRGADLRVPDRTSMSLLATEAGTKTVIEELWGVAEGTFQ